MDIAIMSAERQEEARQYQSFRYRLQVIDFLISLAYAAVLIFGGALALNRAVTRPWLYILILSVGQYVLSLPTSYAAYRVARRFGISVQSFGGWLGDELKGAAVGLVLYLLAGLFVLWAWAKAPTTWHLWFGVAACLFYIALGFVAPVLLMPLFHKYQPIEEGELKDRLMDLSRRAKVFVRGVFVADVSKKETALNANLSGVGATRRIVLYDTLIQNCTVDEIEVIMAHEMGHHAHNHIPKLNAIMCLFLLGVSLVAGYALDPLSRALGLGGLTPAALPLMLMLFTLVGIALLPALMAFSRHTEREADTFALTSTGKGAAFITAFRKLADKNLADLNPPRWHYIFFRSHPLIQERIALAERYQQ